MRNVSSAFVLASGSPRRREILQTLGLSFDIQPVDIDERQIDGESALILVARLAKEKAMAAVGEIALGADTVVVLDEQVLGKPRDVDEAVQMLTALSGRTHQVITGVALQTPQGMKSAISCTAVRFRKIGRDEAIRYWHSGEPADKAGAYGIQGLGGIFVEAIDGSFTGVMGLPVFETVGLLRTAGIHLLIDQQ